MFVVETSAPAETEALGAELAADLRTGDVVLIAGELGSGKTTLVRGAARALGVSDPVTSPTFGIAHRYRGARCTVAHLDLYRLASLDDEDPALLDDYLGPDRIAFVEWPAAGLHELEDSALRVTLTHLGGDRRRIEVAGARRADSAGREPGADCDPGSDDRGPSADCDSSVGRDSGADRDSSVGRDSGADRDAGRAERRPPAEPPR